MCSLMICDPGGEGELVGTDEVAAAALISLLSSFPAPAWPYSNPIIYLEMIQILNISN